MVRRPRRWRCCRWWCRRPARSRAHAPADWPAVDRVQPAAGSGVALPLIETIRADLGLGHAALGLLMVVPILCMGALLVVAVRLAAQVGNERGLLLAIMLVAIAIASRAGGKDPFLLLGSTFLAGIGIALAQVLVPAVIKRHFPDHAVLVMGLYSTAMTIGAGASAGLAIPLARRLGSWPLALAAWSVPAFLAAAVWLPAARRRGTQEPAAGHAGLPWRSGTAWLVAVFSGATFCSGRC